MIEVDRIKLPNNIYLKPVIGQHSRSLKQRIKFECLKCSETKSISLYSVITGYTKSIGCGCMPKVGKPHKTPIIYNKEFWYRFFSLYQLPKPTHYEDISIGSGKKFIFICICGNKYTTRWSNPIKRKKLTCGECNNINPNLFKFPNGFKFVDKLPKSFNPLTYKKFNFQCKCGNINKKPFKMIWNGSQKSCGECNIGEYKSWVGKTFGKFTVLEFLGSKIKRLDGKSGNYVMIKCFCGNEKEVSVSDIKRNRNNGCGKCYENGKKLRDNKKEKLSLLNQNWWFSDQMIEPIHPLKDLSSKHLFLCKICNIEFKTWIHDIRRGKIISCGCITGKTSSLNISVAKFLKLINLNPLYGQHEYKIGKYLLDIYLTKYKLGIELNGLYWHNEKTKDKELDKFKICQENGITLLSFFEDEWINKRSIVESIIKNSLGINYDEQIKLRPKECEILIVSNKKCEKLLDKHHIQGSRNDIKNIGIYHNNILIGVVSFSKPTRQTSKYKWELTRMIMNPKYIVHGIWSKIISNLHKFDINGSIVSFSDNRIFTGKVYNYLGFKQDGFVRPDYFWTDNRNRFHKSKMRKPQEAINLNMTENQYWKSKGYHKIWDLGKTRWVTNI